MRKTSKQNWRCVINWITGLRVFVHTTKQIAQCQETVDGLQTCEAFSVFIGVEITFQELLEWNPPPVANTSDEICQLFDSALTKPMILWQTGVYLSSLLSKTEGRIHLKCTWNNPANPIMKLFWTCCCRLCGFQPRVYNYVVYKASGSKHETEM